MSIHIQTWSGSSSARITDMTDAGKRGKMCHVLRFQGDPCTSRHDSASRIATFDIMRRIEALTPKDTYEYAQDVLTTLIEDARAAGVADWAVNVYHETIKAIRAPRPVLTAGVDGKWSASANEDGISMRQLDDINEWSEITPHDQSKVRAYELAAKVWPRVQAALSLRAAADILRDAGCKLHGYCAMD